ncbi:hypothetical protein CAter282_3786 [Collimonas arenae]|uniref:Uncharacterized protein n=1 Tax=Collimonas arenae TaxID=279058 RepID=A0A127QN65_9BURK|nr:DUF6572 domain-containing protein [Collimonas arenae]AMP01568.1 hypothetical protein CAter10_4132 [Collimonas arenae]AMP11464.1 hypothetical protein CAter282_3786 [Collimonas arenae]
MTVENAGVIDAAGIAKDSGEVVLTISDHLPWHNEPEHFRFLERKIGKYLDFIQSGQLLESIPQAEGRAIRISIFCKYKPNESAAIFLRAAQQQLDEVGVGLSFATLPDGY